MMNPRRSRRGRLRTHWRDDVQRDPKILHFLKIVHFPAILEIIYILLLLEFIIIQRSKKDTEINKNYSKKTQKSVQNSFPKKYIEGCESGQSLKRRVSLAETTSLKCNFLHQIPNHPEVEGT